MADKKLFHRLKSGPGAEAVGIIPVDMTLGQLRDVDDSAKRDNFVLTYDATTQKYIMVAQTGGSGGGQTSGGGGSVILEAHSGTFLLPTVAQTTLTTTAVNTLVNHYIPSLTGSDVTGFITNTVSGGRGRLTFPKAGFITLLVEGFITIHSTTIGTSGSVGHLVFEADWYSSTGTKKDGFVSSEAIHDASSLAYRDPVSICAGLIPVMANDYIEFKIGFETNVTNKNIRISIPAATDSQRENVDVFFYDRMEVEDWAKKNNATLIPANKLPSTGGGGLTQSQVDARVRAITSNWAEFDNTDPIPANKLTNAPAGGGGLNQSQVDARVRAGTLDWAETGNTDPIPADKLTNAPSSGGGGGSSTLTGLTDTPADLGKEGQVLISETTKTKWDYLRHLGEPDINEMQILRQNNPGTLENEFVVTPLYENYDLMLLKTKLNGELESVDIRLLEEGGFTDQDGYSWDKDERKFTLGGDKKAYYVALVRFDEKNRFIDDDTDPNVAGYQSATLQGENVDNFDFVAAGVTENTSGEIRLIPIDLMKGAGLGGRRFETDTGVIFRVTEVSDNYLVSAIQSDGTQQNNIHSMLPFKAAEVNKIVSNWNATATSFVLPVNFDEDYDSVVIVYGTDAQASSGGVRVDEFLANDISSRTDLGFTYTASSRTVEMGSGNKVRFVGLVKYATTHSDDYIDQFTALIRVPALKEVYTTELTTVKNVTINKSDFGDVTDDYIAVLNLGGTPTEQKTLFLELSKTSGSEGVITYNESTIVINLGNSSTQYIKGLYTNVFRDQTTTNKVFTSLNGLRGGTAGGYQTFNTANKVLTEQTGDVGLIADVLINGQRKKIFTLANKNIEDWTYFRDSGLLGAQSTTKNTQGNAFYFRNYSNYSTFYIYNGVAVYNIWYFSYNNIGSANTIQLNSVPENESTESGKTITTLEKASLTGDDKCILFVKETYWSGVSTAYRYYEYNNFLIVDKTKTSGTDGLITYSATQIKIAGRNAQTTNVTFQIFQLLEELQRPDKITVLNRVTTSTTQSRNISFQQNVPYNDYTMMLIGGNSQRNSQRQYPYFFGIGAIKYQNFLPTHTIQLPGNFLSTAGYLPFHSTSSYIQNNGWYQNRYPTIAYLSLIKIDSDEIFNRSSIISSQNTLQLPPGWENADYLFVDGGFSRKTGIIDVKQIRQESFRASGISGTITVSGNNIVMGTGTSYSYWWGQRLLVKFKDLKTILPLDITSTVKTITLSKQDLDEYNVFIFSFNGQSSMMIPRDILSASVDLSFPSASNGYITWIWNRTTRSFTLTGNLNFVGCKAVNFGGTSFELQNELRQPLAGIPSVGSFLGLRDTPGRYPAVKRFVTTKEDSSGLEFSQADALDINASDVNVNADLYANNLSDTDTDLQKVANKVNEGTSTPKRVNRLPSNHTEGEEYYLTQEYPSQTFDVTPVTFRGTEFEGTDLGTRGWAKYEHVAEGGGGFDDVGAITPHHPDGLIMISDKKIAVKDGTLQNLRTLVLSVTTGGTTTITSRRLTLTQGTAPLIATSKGNVDTYTYNADLPAGNWDGLYFRDASNRVVGTAMVKKGKYTSFNGDLQPSGFNADDADIDDEIKFLVEVLEKLGRTDKTVRFLTDGSHFFTANDPFMDPRIVKVSYGRDAADTNYYRRYVVFARLSYIDDDVNNTPEAIAVGTKTLNLSYFESDTGGIVRYRSAVTQVAGDRIASSGATKSINVRFKDKTWSGHDQINKYIRNLDISVLRSNILDKIKDYARKSNTSEKIPKDDFSTTLTRAQWTALSTANKRANHVYYITS